MKKTYTAILHMVLIVALSLGVYVSSSTHEAAELWPEGHHIIHDYPMNVPDWQPTDAHDGCAPEAWEGFQTLLIVTQQNERKIVSFAEGTRLTHNKNTADDIWVIGFCA